jgi:hypothetical protein
VKNPFKCNRSSLPLFLHHILPSKADPRLLCTGKGTETDLTSAVSSFKFGETFKSTQKARFPLTISELAGLNYQSPPVILEIGASDGSTSLDIMKSIPFEKYFVTDLNNEAYFIVSGDVTWFYDEMGKCILRASNKWIVYPDFDSAVFPLNKFARALFKAAPKFSDSASKICLVKPALQSLKDDRVTIQKYNMFQPWTHEKADLIVAANILNLCYFTASEIIGVVKGLISALNDKGFIAIIDNRPNEQSSIFSFSDGNLRLEKRISRGSGIESLIMDNIVRNTLSGQGGSRGYAERA